MNALVECNALSKWYGRVVGINDVNVVIKPGVVGLLGPNGAGKSTMIKLMVGALRPSKGQLRVLGEQVWGNRALLARIGYCPEHDGVYDDLSAVEFVTAMARISGIPAKEAESRAKATLVRLGLEKAMHRALGGYSKGMRQRSKLAQAIVHDPEIVLLDEPLTGCDPLARVQLVEIIRELGDSGKAVIVSSHILHEIESMTDEIVLLYKGQVLAEGNIYRIRGMIDEHPHKIKVSCSNARQLGHHLALQPPVSALRFDEDDEQAVMIETKQPDGCYPLIPKLALEHEIKVSQITSPDNNLQAVFDYLTRDRKPEGVSNSKAAKGRRDAQAANVKVQK
jgi:ABC-2 type transport system ATP-binding protein